MYKQWLRDTVTMEMVYDDKDRLTVQVAYEGPKIDSLNTSIREWENALTKGVKQPSYSQVKVVDRNGVKAQFLITYAYDYGGLLSTCLAYDHHYTGITTDTLHYNEKLLLVRIESHSLDYVHATSFTYKNRRVIGKTEGHYYIQRAGSQGSDLGPYTETYSYDSSKRMVRIDVKPDEKSTYPSKTFVEITYK
jgi:hypothetical protein